VPPIITGADGISSSGALGITIISYIVLVSPLNMKLCFYHSQFLSIPPNKSISVGDIVIEVGSYKPFGSLNSRATQVYL